MKPEIHPEYHQAKITCGGCGTVYTFGSVQETIDIGVCSNCHPFYTGKSKLVDSEGRVDRFKKKYEKFSKAAK
ncbi:MAG: 50S ribosomal protein L31 [Bdellovibrionales bacterium]|nr:50S ribosomal protein L31 [Bdellovibrionales bacterium]